jgi:hypothetical protein
VNVGWFPLGPREVFVPSYPVSRTYVNNVNISNTNVNQTVINNYYNTTIVNKSVTVNNIKYVNQSVPGGVTATSGQAFTSAQPVGRNMVLVNQREISSAPVAVRAPAVVPPKQAVLGAGAATSAHPPVAIQNRQVVAKSAPPPPPPSFTARQAAIERNQGQPLSVAQAHQLATGQTRAAVAPVKMAPPSKPATPVYNQQDSRANNTPGPLNTNRPSNAQSNSQSYTPNSSANRPGNMQNAKSYQDRPPSSRPQAVNQQLEQKHQQEIQQLQQKQDQQYQKVQQKQTQEQQKLQQQNIAEERQQQLQQQHQQQLQELEQQHQQQQQQLQQKQQAEHQKAYNKEPQSKPSKEEKHK